MAALRYVTPRHAVPAALGLLALCAQGAPQQSRASPAPVLVRVTGRLLDDRGHPIAGAGIATGPAGRLLTADALDRPVARSDAEGTFACDIPALPDQLPSAMPGLLVAAPGKVALRWAYQDNPYAGGSRRDPAAARIIDLGDLQLPDGGELRGRVRGPGGRGLAGARVTAMDLLGGWNIFQHEATFASTAVTAADGSFTVPCVFAIGLRLRVSAEGHHDRVLAPVNLGEPLVVELQESGLCEGVVLGSDGKPFPSAVFIQYETGLTGLRSELTHRRTGGRLDTIEPCQQTLAGADGRFLATVRFPGFYRLYAGPPRGPLTLESDVLDGPRRGVVLRFQAGVERGLLVQAQDKNSGASIPRVRALALWREVDSLKPQDLARICGAAGTYAAAGGPVAVFGPGPFDGDRGILYLEAEGFAPFSASDLRWAPDQKAPHVAQLTGESLIEGRVVDAAGKAPIAGAEVACHPVVPADGMEIPEEFIARARSAPDGSFRIGSLAAGSYELVARVSGRPASEPATTRVKTTETVKGLELRVAAGIAVTVKLAGVKLGASWRLFLDRETTLPPAAAGQPERQYFAPAGEARAGADGAFSLPGQMPGRFQVRLVMPTAARQGSPRAMRLPPFTIAGGEAAPVLDAAGTVPCVLQGHVALTGAGVPNGRLLVVTSPRPIGRTLTWTIGRPGETEDGKAILGADGVFTITTVPGRHHLVVADVLTGCILYRHPAPLEAGPGARLQVDPTFALCTARVRLTAEQKQRATVDSIEMRRAAPDPAAGPAKPWDPPWDGWLWVGDGTEEFTLLLPPTALTLLAKSGAGMLYRGGRPAPVDSHAPLGEVPLEPKGGDQLAVTLPIGPPLDLPDR